MAGFIRTRENSGWQRCDGQFYLQRFCRCIRLAFRKMDAGRRLAEYPGLRGCHAPGGCDGGQ